MKKQNKQQGVALVYCLIIMLVLTIIGVSITSTLTSSTKLIANQQDNQIALEAAEVALMDAEQWLFSKDNPEHSPIGTEQTDDLKVWLRDNKNTLWKKEEYWEKAKEITNYTTMNDDQGKPKYIIEYYGNNSSSSAAPGDSKSRGQPKVFYRVSAMGNGPGKSTAYLQTIIMKNVE
ncbi:pilus assembly PilX family protein [Spartinivicinus poritis]|uniref:PilX N-terminal domain-containing pilus assembly protein n=1 Tax=Spartinivicinus poritis TaxID=2994640 RepID=A0ABT5UCI5_9GAMM|nr:PilX N-terminal domain-containing pilus assembly protein [Spartinivicinus sp. A2-2]MDE1464088.1 PilX N-terminal domain-containing pilus assembly protein [Spartinivicinus sp. A2-2]